MYLDGVGPNSSVDCFGFVTVQMTFNGWGSWWGLWVASWRDEIPMVIMKGGKSCYASTPRELVSWKTFAILNKSH